ncbi:uncharacterized protein BDZ99DRAFT_551535 [Mytilinidion resinicola]|uniref:Uncharacterized protein n=1 Tax=Mytilinidion resinicola TaxID=574789 RepID=A0A6A6Y0F6_9PEZI|nr:uncharacterized protein BDZ99DRAFT_551535 [Mytilinidion resinicola]KAF2802252.1 hypothetical protein BDZ99DRAFT_551535 [Mytilinidion resinicola]
MFQSKFRFVCLIAFTATVLLSVTLTYAHPTSTVHDHGLRSRSFIRGRNEQTWETPESTKILQSRDDRHCGFIGNNDIYGTGIRIGIYTQTLAVWFAKYFLVSQAPFLRDSITVFTVALFIVSILYAAVNASEIYAVEGFIILQIFAWQCLTGARTQGPHNKENFRNSVTRRVFTECMDIGCQSLLVWFWFHGIEKMMKTPCETVTFFLAKVNMFGWFRTYVKIVPILALVGHVHRIGLEAVNLRSYFMFQKAKRGFLETAARYKELERQEREKPESGDVPTIDHQGTLVNACDSGHLDEGRDQPSQGANSPTSQPPSRRLSQGSETTVSPVSSQFQEQARRTSQGSEIAVSPMPSQPQSPSRESATPPPKSDFPIFEDVYHGSLYLTRCMSATPSTTLTGYSARLYKFYTRLPLGHRAQVTETPHYDASEALAISSCLPSFLACHRHVLTHQLTFRFPRRAALFYTHLACAHLVDDWNVPYQLYAALTYPACLPPGTYAPLPSHAGTAIAAAILLPAAPERAWTLAESWVFTVSHLWIHVFFITQLGLTIRWNGEGLTGLASVGQLIPFVIGVGSLGLVLVRWVERWCRGRLDRGRGRRGKMGSSGRVGVGDWMRR